MSAFYRNFLFVACLFSFFDLSAFGNCGRFLVSRGFDKYETKYAKNFDIFLRESDNFTIWRVGDYWYGSKKITLSSDCPVIEIPKLDKVILMSSTLLEAFVEIGVETTIVGVGEKKYIYDGEKKLKDAIDLGTIPSLEKVLSLKPDILFGYSSPTLKVFYDKVRSLGIKVIFINDFASSHPLSRAEQRVLIGSLYKKLSESKAMFDSIVNSYQRTLQSVDKRVGVLLGRQTASGAWRNIDKTSDFYQVVRDAGGDDLLSDFSSSVLSLEEILKKRKQVDYWLPQYTYRSLNQIRKESNFLRVLLTNPSFKVSSYNKKITPLGGAEFWDVAMLRPDLLIRDLVMTFETSSRSYSETTRWYEVIE